MLNEKQKNAIENLLILADYIKEHAIYSGEMKKIIDNSILQAENLIGKTTSQQGKQTNSKSFIVESIMEKFHSDNS